MQRTVTTRRLFFHQSSDAWDALAPRFVAGRPRITLGRGSEKIAIPYDCLLVSVHQIF